MLAQGYVLDHCERESSRSGEVRCKPMKRMISGCKAPIGRYSCFRYTPLCPLGLRVQRRKCTHLIPGS